MFRFFALPWLPEAVLRFGGYRALAGSFAQCGRPAAFPPEEIGHYRVAWSRDGALTGMLNWYRALLRKALPASADLRVETPVLLIWGLNDPFGLKLLADRSLALCADARPLFSRTPPTGPSTTRRTAASLPCSTFSARRSSLRPDTPGRRAMDGSQFDGGLWTDAGDSLLAEAIRLRRAIHEEPEIGCTCPRPRPRSAPSWPVCRWRSARGPRPAA